MKKTLLIILACLCAAFLLAACSPVNGDIAIIKSMQAALSSGGAIRFSHSITGVESNVTSIYTDDKYQYYLSYPYDGAHFLHGSLLDLDARNADMFNSVDSWMPEAEMTELGNALARELFPNMDWASSEITITPRPRVTGFGDSVVVQMAFRVEERANGALINSSSFDLDAGGTVTYFSKSANDPARFSRESHISVEQAQTIAFEAAMAHKKEREEWPGVVLSGEAIEDFEFVGAEQRMSGVTVEWIIEIKPLESWGEYNAIDDYHLEVGIDAETGEVRSVNTNG